MPNSTGDDETPLTDGLRLPGGDVRMLVRLHRARLAARQPMPTMQEQLAAADQITTGDRHSLDRRVRLGLVREVEPGRFRPTLRGAVITASRQLPPMKGRVDRQATQKAEEWIVRLPPEVG